MINELLEATSIGDGNEIDRLREAVRENGGIEFAGIDCSCSDAPVFHELLDSLRY